MRIQIDPKSFDLGFDDGKTKSQSGKSTRIADELSYWSGFIEGAAVAENEKTPTQNQGSEGRDFDGTGNG